MAKKWQNGDSARTMTAKYNETATEVEGLKKASSQINQLTQLELDRINEELEKKVEGVNKSDVGLGNVDNTSDLDKPVSKPQARAIDNAVEDMITSEPADNFEIEGESTGFITGISVKGTTLIITI